VGRGTPLPTPYPSLCRLELYAFGVSSPLKLNPGYVPDERHLTYPWPHGANNLLYCRIFPPIREHLATLLVQMFAVTDAFANKNCMPLLFVVLKTAEVHLRKLLLILWCQK